MARYGLAPLRAPIWKEILGPIHVLETVLIGGDVEHHHALTATEEGLSKRLIR